MRRILVALVLAASSALSACQYCVYGEAPRLVPDQPLGAHCALPWECADGLECLGRTCTVACSVTQACPAASLCMEAARDASGTLLQICVPACQSDADCLLGATVGTCTAPATVPGFCIVRSCTTDDECRGVGRCVGVSEARGITWNDTCHDGFCQR